MNETTSRFLNSLGIIETEKFDLRFCDKISRIPGTEKWLLFLEKETPWEYELLQMFCEGLAHADFTFELHLSYTFEVKAKNALDILSQWYQSIYHLVFDYEYVDVKEKSLVFTYSNSLQRDKYAAVLDEFAEFLKFIGYHDIELLHLLVENEMEIEEIEEEHQVFVEEESVRLHKESQEAATKAEEQYTRSLAFKKGNYKEIKIHFIDTNTGNVDFTAKVFHKDDPKQRKNGKIIQVAYINDETGSIPIKIFEGSINMETIKKIEIGKHVRIRGAAQFDSYSNELNVVAHYLDFIHVEEKKREDKSSRKRVELHAHTKFSAMDSVGSIEDYCQLAKAWGHTAFAITDHGVIQSYPNAQAAAKKYGIKMLYGCELYMVDDILPYIQNPAPRTLLKSDYVVFDFETTGLSAKYDRVIEFGACRFSKGMKVATIDLLIDPEIAITPKITKLTNITKEMVSGKPKIKEAINEIMKFIGDAILVSHNADFDIGFLNAALTRLGHKKITNPVIDTLSLSRYMFPENRAHNLGALARNFDIMYEEGKAHRADYDAEVLNEIWQSMLAAITKDNDDLLHEDLGHLPTSEEMLRHFRPKHVVVLAKNLIGLKNIYKLVSFSHIEYLADLPKVPRSVLAKHREGLLLGSACFNGEVFDTASTRRAEELEERIKFYDYIEIQPLENYQFLVDDNSIDSLETIKKYLLDIVECAEKQNKIVVATGDVHYPNPEDKTYRDVYIFAKGVGGVRHPLNPYRREHQDFYENPNQHFRTTEEMLGSLSFLGDRAEKYVIDNTNLIADMIETIHPLKDKLYTPTIENCEQILKSICYETAHKWYGTTLPLVVAERLDKELGGIIKHGFSVIYYIAHKIVKKANDDGFMVGSRGSVGSSFVATMAGITEVNPLPPHYRCPTCQYSSFTKCEGVRNGYDLPEQNCPHCGATLIRDGQDIPFATFLGFNAEKVPDIDLNFPSIYQPRAHDYTKELLGEGNVFRAGTIGTVEVKTAFGYVRGYFERMGLDPDSVSRSEILRIAKGCTDVKRTTGQHPGGIVVIPREFEVFDFTPIQYPADEKEASWKTTHFDFNAIHDNVLKLDLLGHVDPLALKMMGELSGVDPLSIPLNDSEVLSLFSSSKALKRNSNYLEEKTGALGIPEFGTSFVRGMLEATNPKNFADLVVISGLSHGTDVWSGNAQNLVEAKICTLQNVIGCRDDIMIYLSSIGMKASLAFKIMEDVRKGKKLKPEYEEEMRKINVPDWYIDSCNKIKYMFPKAHATAYVTMAIRVGWYKVYRPLEFYATFFSVRSKQYDIGAMKRGREAIIAKLNEIKDKRFRRISTPKEEEIEKTLFIALEMVERGYKFGNIDINRSLSDTFVVDHEEKALIPPFTVVDGLGLSAAESVIEARKNGPFFSREDLLKRTKINSQNMTNLIDQHVVDDLPESDQLDLLSFSF